MLGNDSAAVATLANLHRAMQRFRDTCVLDLDGDGVGEFGTFQELSGAAWVRGTRRSLSPPLLSGAFRGQDRDGRVSRSGFYFRIWLPGRDGRGTRELPPLDSASTLPAPARAPGGG